MLRVEPPIAVIELGPSSQLDAAQLDALDAALDACARDAAVRAVVLSGCSDTAFSEGLCPEAILSLRTRREAAALAARAAAVAERIERFDKPVVAALHGAALGAGLALALACRARVASSALSTRLALDEATHGLVPLMAGLERLAQVCGVGRALALFESSARLGALEALRAGVVDAVLPREELMGAAARLALEAPRPRGRALGWGARASAELALAGARARASREPDQPALTWGASLLSAFVRGGRRASDELALRAFAELAPSTAARARLELAVGHARLRAELGLLRAEHGAPRRVAIVGASAAGAALAAAALEAGAAVSWADHPAELATADLVVEAARAAPGDRRARALRLLEAMPARAVLAVAEPPGSLASLLGDAATDRDVVGVRVTRRLVELSMRGAAEPRALAFASLLAEAPPRAAVLTPDAALGVCGRFARAFEREVEHLLAQGATREELADAALDWGFTPLELRPRRPGGPRRGRITPEETQARLAMASVNEAFLAMEDLGLDAHAVDVAATFGHGFPAFRGGPVAYARSLGPAELSARIALFQKKYGARFAPAPALARFIARETGAA